MSEPMTTKKECACDHLLLVCRQVQRRFDDGHMPTFEQLDNFKGAIEAFDVMLICGHKVIDECDCTGA